MSDPIIICRDVHKWFGRFHALRGINMEVRTGEVIVIFGPSGSGKSTFIRTINRLEEHQRGQIIVDGIELTGDIKNVEKIREETGMVFQQFNLFPHLTVRQNITLCPIQVRKWPKEKAEKKAMELLSRVGIPEQASLVIRPVGSLVDQLAGDPYDRAIQELFGEENPQTLVQDIVRARRDTEPLAYSEFVRLVEMCKDIVGR